MVLWEGHTFAFCLLPSTTLFMLTFASPGITKAVVTVRVPRNGRQASHFCAMCNYGSLLSVARLNSVHSNRSTQISMSCTSPWHAWQVPVAEMARIVPKAADARQRLRGLGPKSQRGFGQNPRCELNRPPWFVVQQPVP